MDFLNRLQCVRKAGYKKVYTRRQVAAHWFWLLRHLTIIEKKTPTQIGQQLGYKEQRIQMDLNLMGITARRT